MAAFQALGPFISTFADPAVSGIQVIYNADGTVQIASVEEMEMEDEESARTSQEVHLSQDVPDSEEVVMESGVTRLKREFEEKEYEAVGKLEVSLGKESPESEFNSFVFWRNPVPVIAVEEGSEGSSGAKGEQQQRPSDAAATDSNTQLSLPTAPGGGAQQDGASPDSGISSPLVSPDSSDAKQQAASQGTAEAVNGGAGDATTEEQNFNEDIKDLVDTISGINLEDKQGAGVTPPEKPERSELGNDSAAAENGSGMLKAAVNEANDLTETAPQIGSTGVIGQRLDEKTLTFVNGIVEEDVGEWSEGGANQMAQEEGSEDEQLFQVRGTCFDMMEH